MVIGEGGVCFTMKADKKTMCYLGSPKHLDRGMEKLTKQKAHTSNTPFLKDLLAVTFVPKLDKNFGLKKQNIVQF